MDTAIIWTVDTSFQQNSVKNSQFTDNRFIYKVKRCLGNSELNAKKITGKFYLSSWTSAFGIPLVQDQNVLVLDGQTSGSFLPARVMCPSTVSMKVKGLRQDFKSFLLHFGHVYLKISHKYKYHQILLTKIKI